MDFGYRLERSLDPEFRGPAGGDAGGTDGMSALDMMCDPRPPALQQASDAAPAAQIAAQPPAATALAVAKPGVAASTAAAAASTAAPPEAASSAEPLLSAVLAAPAALLFPDGVEDTTAAAGSAETVLPVVILVGLAGLLVTKAAPEDARTELLQDLKVDALWSGALVAAAAGAARVACSAQLLGRLAR